MTGLGAYIRRNHLALIALIIAVIGVPAAWALGANTIGSRQIKPGAVRTSDIRDGAVNSHKVREGSLRRSDFAAGQAPATLFGFIQDGAGKPIVGYGNGVKGVTQPNDGEYLVQFNQDLSGCAAGAATGLGAPIQGSAGNTFDFASGLSIQGTNNDSVDVTFNNSVDTSFFITVTC